MIRRIPLLVLIVLAPLGCQTPPGPIFPAVDPPIVWPPSPDIPRIRYIGALTGEASLNKGRSGWENLRAVLAGPKPKVVFSRPSAVAVAGPHVFIADTGLAAVHCLNLQTRDYKLIPGTPVTRFRIPIDVMAGPHDELLVADRARRTLDRFTLDGAFIATDALPQDCAPTAVTVAEDGHLWIADAEQHRCLRWPPEPDGAGGTIGVRGSAPGLLNFPTGLAWRADVGLVVADAMNFRVQVFQAGVPVVIFGQKGDAAGDFALPRDVAIDSAGHIYVLDNQFENVQIFDRAGQLLMAFGGSGDGPGEFSLPSGITIDDRDRIWIADSYNRRVQVFQYLAEDAS